MPGEFQKYSDRTDSGAGPGVGGRAGHVATWWPSPVPGLYEYCAECCCVQAEAIVCSINVEEEKGEGGEEGERREERSEEHTSKPEIHENRENQSYRDDVCGLPRPTLPLSKSEQQIQTMLMPPNKGVKN